MKNALSIFLAAALLLPAALPAKAGRTGAEVEMELLGGMVVRGELHSLDGETIAVSAARGGDPKIFDLPQVVRIRVLRASMGKRATGVGILAGIAIGATLGAALGNNGQSRPGSMGMRINMLPMLTVPVGALAGAAILTQRGKRIDLQFLFRGQSEEARAEAVAKLNALAREPREI